MADDISAYGKGYRAGRKRLEADDMRCIERIMREDFIQRMMISIAPQVISSPWRKKRLTAHSSRIVVQSRSWKPSVKLRLRLQTPAFFEAPPIEKDTPQ